VSTGLGATGDAGGEASLRAIEARAESPSGARDGGAEAPLHVVATAGHVDHGKSSLIARLTDIDPDRLEEEKRRGLTIDLGFAWCTLPSGREIGFVDVPGHERFVRTMLSGVGPVRLVLFVVAADEGWKPQSEEHLAIVDVLGVQGGVVALTKRDLVDADRARSSERTVRERLAGTTLADAPIVACSSATGEGIDDLVAALDAMLSVAPAPVEGDRPRQFVDRVFSVAGAGTVVTGTLTGGRLAAGEEVELFPGGDRARIRSLQTHKRQIQTARPVSRVAANLTGVERSRIERGDVLGRPGDWRPTDVIEARIRPVRGLTHPLSPRGAFTFHAGAAERSAKIRLYDAASVSEDGAFARIRLSSPLVLDVHDRFVLRESGRRETVAGGVVLDPAPPQRRGATAVDRLERRERAGREEIPALLLAERGAVRETELRSLTGFGEIPGAERVSGWWISERVRSVATSAAIELLTAHHDANPASEGSVVAEVRRAVADALRRAGSPADGVFAASMVDDLVQRGTIARSGSFLRLPSHRAEVAPGELDRLTAAVAAGEPTPPSVSELQRGGFARETIDSAVRSGALVRIAPDLVLTPAFVERAVGIVREAKGAGITVGDVRARLGTSRKYAVPLMEHLDRTGATRRSGDLRFARGT
jgi:selenocysteine-specific elongation factor